MIKDSSLGGRTVGKRRAGPVQHRRDCVVWLPTAWPSSARRQERVVHRSRSRKRRPKRPQRWSRGARAT